MSIIFIGDIAIPFDTPADVSKVEHIFKDSLTVANLEGAVLTDRNEVSRFRYSDKFSLYSSPAVAEVLEKCNVGVVSLCNNHILDYKADINNTCRWLNERNILNFGLRNHDLLSFTHDGRKIHLITFATYACEHSLKLFSPAKVIAEIERLRSDAPDALIVCYPHWGREQFYLPDPADRQLAHMMIDAGADLIVGHHPHIILPVESYKGKTIVYSVGNFMLPETKFGDRLLKFRNRDICHELAVKWDNGNVTLIPLKFNTSDNSLHPDPNYTVAHLENAEGIPPEDKPYRRMVASRSGIADRLLRTRTSNGRWGERICWLKRRGFRLVRCIAISAGLHRPYSNK